MKLRSSIVWGCVAGVPIYLAGCGSDRQDVGGDSHTPLVEPGTCTEAAAGSGFVNSPIGYEGNEFWAEFDATPGAAGIDAVIGFSDGVADAFSDLAVAVRFNPEGFIDARNGDAYGVYTGPMLAYQPGTRYHFRLQIRTGAHTYSATVATSDGGFSWLASDAAFRPSQQAALELTHLVGVVDSSAGSIAICNYGEPYRDRCVRNDAGSGWQNQTFWQNSGITGFRGIVKPTQASVDAVIGFANGPADAFTDLAAIVRFNPSGMVDARNGSVYEAVAPLAYRTGALYTVDATVDVRQKRYSATVGGVQIARDFAFRSEQAGIVALDTTNSFVDSPSGGLILCNTGLFSVDRTVYSVPSAAGQLASGRNGALYETSVYDYDTQTGSLNVREAASGSVLRTLPLRGRGRTDAAGNLYLAGTFEASYDPGSGPLTSVGGSDVFVAKYTPELVPVWGRAFGGAANDGLTDIATDGLGRVTVLGPTIGTVVLEASGATLRQTQDGAHAVAANAAGELALAGGRTAESGPEIWLERRDPNGQALWRRAFPARTANVALIALSTAGDVVFAGQFNGTVNFGGADLRWSSGSGEGPNQAGYIVALSSSGEHRWSSQNDFYTSLSDLVVDRSGNVTLAGTGGNQIYYATVIKYAGDSGAGLWRQSFEPDRSTTQSVAIDEAGAVYWNLTLLNYAEQASEPRLIKLGP